MAGLTEEEIDNMYGDARINNTNLTGEECTLFNYNDYPYCQAPVNTTGYSIACDWNDEWRYLCNNCSTDNITQEETCNEFIAEDVKFWQKKKYTVFRNTTTCHFLVDRPVLFQWRTGYINMRYQYFLQNNISNSSESCQKPDNLSYMEEWHNYTKGDVLWIGDTVNATDPANRGQNITA